MVVIDEPEELTLSVTQNGRDFTVSASGGTEPYEYAVNGGSFQSSEVFAELSSGSFIFTVQDANDCLATSDPIELVLATNPPMQFEIYPNPVARELIIKGIDYNRLVLFDLNGRVLLSTDRKENLSIEGIRNGILLLYLYDKNGEIVHQQKLIKQ